MPEIATVITSELNIHNRPGDGRGVIGSVPKDTKLVVINHHPGLKADWVQIEPPVGLPDTSVEYWAAVRNFASGVRFLSIEHTAEPPPLPPTMTVEEDVEIAPTPSWQIISAAAAVIAGLGLLLWIALAS